MDLIEENPMQFLKIKKEATIIKEIQHAWEQRMEQLRNRLLLCEEVSKRQARILADTEFSKGQNIPGAFTAVEEIDKFIESCIETKKKNERIYCEVRFHRKTSTRKKLIQCSVLEKGQTHIWKRLYANNMKSYLSKTKRLKSICISIPLKSLTVS